MEEGSSVLRLCALPLLENENTRRDGRVSCWSATCGLPREARQEEQLGSSTGSFDRVVKFHSLRDELWLLPIWSL